MLNSLAQGIEQLYRDNRITPIYEGTNSVQAADLVFRKLSNKNGNIIKNFLDLVKSETNSNDDRIIPFTEKFSHYLNILTKFSKWTIEKAKTDKDDVSAGANDYLKTLGYVSVAYAWIKVLEVSFKDYDENKKFYGYPHIEVRRNHESLFCSDGNNERSGYSWCDEK